MEAEKVKRQTAEAVAKKEIKERKRLEKDIAVQKMSAALALKIYRDGMSKDEAVASYAGESGLDLKEAKEIAQQINL